MKEHLEAREVLGGAYHQKKFDGTQALLTHAVRCDEKGHPIQPLCRRVKADSLCDAGSLYAPRNGYAG